MNKISALHPPLKLCCRMKCSSLFFKIKTWQNTWINSCMAFWNLSTKSQIYLSSKNEEFDKLSLELLMMQTLIFHWKRKNSFQLSIHYLAHRELNPATNSETKRPEFSQNISSNMTLVLIWSQWFVAKKWPTGKYIGTF